MFDNSEGISRRTFVAVGAAAGIASIGMLSGCAEKESTPEPKPEPEQDDKGAAAPARPEQQTAERLYIVDTFVPKPDDGEAFLNDYMTIYKPMAEKAGMVLESSTVAPPIWLGDDSNTIQVIWSLADIAVEAWAMNSATRYDPAYVEWCADVRKRVLSRDRSYFASEAYMEVLNNV